MKPAGAVDALLLADETEYAIETHASRGDRLFIWIPSEAGPQSSGGVIAQALANKGIEVWRVDPMEARFLPTAQSSMDRIPKTDVAALIQYAIEQSGKKVFVVTTGRGAIPVLRGVRHWQAQHLRQNKFGGVILMSPKFFVETPDPGEAARLMPVVQASNVPVFILQPKKSPWFWKLHITVPALEKGGADVFVQRIENVRDRFYFRPDAVDAERQKTRQLPDMLVHAARLLEGLPVKLRRPAQISEQAPAVRVGKKERRLTSYVGEPTPPALNLQDLHGKHIDLSDLKGQVVLVNFWASWCPPCVYEMPSMQRLQDTFKDKGFVILGVNMAEDKHTILRFLKDKVSVRFPILLDSDGAALKRWQVFAFPTSYVIDRQGKIRYALFGGVEWDTPEISNTIVELLKE